MSAVCGALDALLQSARDVVEDGGIISLEEQQALHCLELVQSLDDFSKDNISAAKNMNRPDSEENVATTNFIRTSIDYNNKLAEKSKEGISSRIDRIAFPARTLTVREVFNNSSASVSRLPPLLASLMMNRIETEKLLPPTQDAQANEEAMNSNCALTLTRPALIAVELYSKLLAIPGAWGSSLIQMEAVSSLAALFRRWRVECVAAIDLLSQSSSKDNNTTKQQKKKLTGKRKSNRPRSTKNLVKRGRGRKRTVVFVGKDSSSESESDYSIEDPPKSSFHERDLENGESSDVISPLDLILFGLRASLALSKVPTQREFMSWSSESRDSVMDALTTMYGTVCALVAPSTVSTLGESILKMRELVLEQASTSMQRCILVAPITVDDVQEETQGRMSISAKRHEMSIFILRGLYPVMVMREHLPNGQVGRQIAYDIAVETLRGIVQAVGEEVEEKDSPWTPANSNSSRAKRSSSKIRRSSLPGSGLASPAPKPTSRKGRKKRVSFCGIDTGGRTPFLKSGKKSSSAVGTPSHRFSGTKPRPVLSAVLGLMEKLATTKGLDKTNLRTSIVKSLYATLRHLPFLERTRFLRFLHRLCQSKVSMHRLLGVELVGLLLTESWLWKEHTDQPIVSPEKRGETEPGSPALRSRTPTRSRSQETTSPSKGLTPSPEIQLHDIPSSLLNILMGRLVDRVPAVRARAASSLSEMLHKVGLVVAGANSDKDNNSFVELLESLASQGSSLLDCLRKRALADEKATVRRVALEALAQLLILGKSDDTFSFSVTEEEVAAFSHLCQDNSMLTRKAAAQALTSLLVNCVLTENEKTVAVVERAWTRSVLPLALDPESGCASKASDMVNEVVFQPIILDDDTDSIARERYNSAFRILCLVCQSACSGVTGDVTPALKAAITKVVVASEAGPEDTRKELLRRICDVAVTTLDGSTTQDLCSAQLESQRSGVWCLFDALVDQTTNLKDLYQTLKKLRIDLDFLGTSWEKMLRLLEIPGLPILSAKLLRACMRSCLKLLAKLASCVRVNVAHQSALNLHSMLQKLNMPPDLIGAAVSALAATSVACSGDADLDTIRMECSARIKSLYDVCEESMSSYAKQKMEATVTDSGIPEVSAVRAIFMVGELSVVGFSPDEDDNITNTNKVSGATESNPLRGLNVKPSKQLVDLILTFLPRNVLASASIRAPESARAHAYTAVGKLCLRDEQLAKKCVNIFSRELHDNRRDGCSSVQSNALLVLGDLCIRYTSIVDRHLPVMASCLQSGIDVDNTTILNFSSEKAAVVRKNAILLLSSLVQGLLFHRFLVTCADDDETVAEIGEGILVGPLLGKNPKLFFNNFVESLFVLNRCTHPIYIAAKSQGDGGAGVAVDFEGINLSGATGRVKRQRMYSLMLSKMTDEEKIGITARLAKEVLGSAASAAGSQNSLYEVCANPASGPSANNAASDREYESAYNVLSDTFTLLSSPLLRVGKCNRSNDDDQDTIEDPNIPNTSRRVIAAKGKLLSKISRKHLIEIVFPILCNLKAILQKSCSPLLKDLMQYMVHIFNNYKIEVKDFLSNDPSLLQEIEYDAKQIKKAVGKATGGEDVAESSPLGDETSQED